MKEAKENSALSVLDVNEDVLSDETDAAKGWIPVALKLARSNADMEV